MPWHCWSRTATSAQCNLRHYHHRNECDQHCTSPRHSLSLSFTSTWGTNFTFPLSASLCVASTNNSISSTGVINVQLKLATINIVHLFVCLPKEKLVNRHQTERRWTPLQPQPVPCFTSLLLFFFFTISFHLESSSIEQIDRSPCCS